MTRAIRGLAIEELEKRNAPGFVPVPYTQEPGETFATGATFSGPPRIFVVLPSSGPAFLPVGIGGSNFAQGAIPYINGVPSVALYNWSTQSLPLIGSISVGATIVPPAAPAGAADLSIAEFGQRSNLYPFTIN